MPRMEFTDAFSAGIRKRDTNPPNTQALISASNLRALEGYGLIPFRDIVEPFSASVLSNASITKSWPFPQLFRGKSVTLLADASAIYSVTESTGSSWTVTPITVYDWSTYNFDTDAASSTTITMSATWQFMDFWGTWMLSNEAGLVFKTPFSSKVFYTSDINILSCTNYNDARVIYSGFAPETCYGLADWPSYWADYTGQLPAGLSSKTLSDGMGPNWVWWSSIGGADMWWLFSLYYMLYGTLSATVDTGFSATNPYWFNVWAQQQAGAMPMPWSGYVLQTQQLGQHLMVYGENGISALTPADITFGLNTIQGISGNVGVHNSAVRACVGGDEQAHAFLDDSSELWVVGPDLRAEYIGGKHLFSTMTNPSISLDPQLREFYIGENDNTYTLAPGGRLTKSWTAPTSLCFGASTGSHSALGIKIDNSSTVPSFQTEWFDAGIEDEVPQVISATIIGRGTWSLGLKYKRSPGDSERDTGVTACDAGGSVDFHTSGVLFSIYGTATDRSTARAQRVVVEVEAGGTLRTIEQWLT